MPLLPNVIVFDPDSFDFGDLPGASGCYEFDALRGEFQPKQQQLEGIIRPGRDGEQLRETGVRGDPFPIVTVLYVATREDAVSAIDAYVTLVDGNPYEVYANGTSMGFFKVLKVINSHFLPCAQTVGTLVPGAEIKHTVAFQLVSTEPPEEEP